MLTIIRRAVVLGAVFSLVSAVTASAGTLLMWEFSGDLTRIPPIFGLPELYPLGTPFVLNVTFDPAAPKISGSPTQGLYQALGQSTLRLGDLTFLATGGYISVNCHFEIGCIPGGPSLFPPVEFWLFGWSPQPLNPAFPGLTTLSDVQVYYVDPNAANGEIPSAPPQTAGLQIAIGGLPPLATLGGTVQSIQALEDPPQVPEPGTFLLLATGLTALVARRRRRITRASSSSQ
jgi:PEP-CTERM motif-containing protein